jgi:hypothetical protein
VAVFPGLKSISADGNSGEPMAEVLLTDIDDAEAAGKLGIPLIGLTCGGWKRSDLKGAGCIEVYPDPADLLLHFDCSALGG